MTVIVRMLWTGAVALCLGVGGVAAQPAPPPSAPPQPQPAPPPPAQPQPAAPPTLAKGWGRLTATGAVASIAPPWALTVTIQGDGRLNVFTGGTAWETRGLSGTRTLGVLPDTLFLDGGGRRLPLASLHPGDRVAVWGVARPDGALLAVSITAHGRGPAQTRAAAAAAGMQGVVLRRSGGTLDLLTEPGARHSVVVTAATIVTRDGRPVPAAEISAYDLLHVDGPVNSDGSLVATRIEVQFTAARAVQVSGPADQVLAAVGGLVVGGAMACTSADTYLVHGTARWTLAQLAAGQPVTVYGVPIAASGTPIGLIARVVVAR